VEGKMKIFLILIILSLINVSISFFCHKFITNQIKYHASFNDYNNGIKDENLDSLMLHIENNMLPKLFKNISKFRPGQRQVVQNILEAKSTLAILPTGAGKSLCYMLPSQLLDGITIVVSPLLAMMRDQVNILHQQGISAARLDSSMNIDEIRQTIIDIITDKIKILYVSPERFNNESFRKIILNKKVSMFVVDEAHCISEWGHAFRPDYLRLSHFANISKAQVKLAVTATATKRVADDISIRLGIDTSNIVRLPSVRKNLNLKVISLLRPNDDYDTRRIQIIENLKLFYNNNNTGSIIIYVSRQKLADRLASDLVDQGFNARAYHAGLKTVEREKIESWFLNNNNNNENNEINNSLNTVNPIVVGTIAFGMGIDCNNVRYIFHFDLPRSIEDYVQGIGRAGRDDKESYCLAFLAQSDIPAIKNQIFGLTPQYIYLKKFIDIIFNASKGFPSLIDTNVMYISYYDLSYECDINELQLRLMMAKLIQNDIITELTPLYGIFKVSIIDEDKLKSLLLLPSFSDNNIDFSVVVDDDNVEYYDMNDNIDDTSINIIPNSNSAVKISKNRMLLCEEIGRYIMEQNIKYPRRKWIEINTIDLANEYSVTPKEIISAISVFISIKICNNGGLSRIYNRFKLHSNSNNNDIINMLTVNSIENQKRSLVRIDEIIALLIKGTCLNNSNDIWNYVGEYFEDNIKIKEKKIDKEKILRLSNQMNVYNMPIDLIEWQKIINLVKNNVLSTDDPYHIARFATGVTSPRIVKNKLSKYDEFGILMHCDWNDVINKCIELCVIVK